MPTCTRPAADSTPEQLRFPAIPGDTVRADFTGGERSSDLGAAILGAVDRRIGMIDRFANPYSAARRWALLRPGVDAVDPRRWQCGFYLRPDGQRGVDAPCRGVDEECAWTPRVTSGDARPKTRPCHSGGAPVRRV